jgi:chromate transporter
MDHRCNFSVLSLIAVGGVNPILPELQRQVVTFTVGCRLRVLPTCSPLPRRRRGPNLLVVTLIGWDVSGLPGALVATLAISAPSGILAYFVSRLWDRFRLAPWRVALQAGLIPVTIGLVAAGAYVIARSADTSLAALLITLITAAALFYTRLHPLVFLAAGAVFGLTGLV